MMDATEEGGNLKLLYVWIEKFRNIRRQGFVIDNEYIVTVDSPDTEQVIYTDYENRRVVFTGPPSKLYRAVYQRKLSIEKNNQYIQANTDSPICSITALVGENASGKTSVMECLHMRADQFYYRNPEQRYYFMVFLDEATNSIVVRTRDIWLIEEKTKRKDLRHNCGYEEYVMPLEERGVQAIVSNYDNTQLLSVYQHRRQETEWGYLVMGLPTIPINLDRRNSRNAFVGAFDFLCAFPQLGGEDNHLVVYLCDDSSREQTNYFLKDHMTAEEYKSYFIYKMAALLFGKLRDFLYHEKPEFTFAGTRIKRPEEETLRKEGRECAEVLAFCSFDFPRSDSDSLVSIQRELFPKQHIAEAIAFFRKSTYVYGGKVAYDRYVDALEKLFLCLYDVEPRCFTELYKLEIPFEKGWGNVVAKLGDCIEADYRDMGWCDSVNVDFEWLSAGEYQLAIMFSGLYQRLNDAAEDIEKRDLILMFDEPEMHMHPETGRRFVANLEHVLKAFQLGGLINRCQIILATQSPFLVQDLSGYTNSIVLVKKENREITIRAFSDLQQLMLPNRTTYSFNLVMYHIFGVPTVELHIELYGYLQNRTGSHTIKSCDNYIASHALFDSKIHSKQYDYTNDSGKTRSYRTLPTYIRNSIDHPDTIHSYTQEEFKTSIEFLIALCK